MPASLEDTPSVATYVVDGILRLPDQFVNYPSTLHIRNCQELKSLGNLKTVNGGLYLSNCNNLEDFGSLSEVRGPLECQGSPLLRTIGNLRKVSGFIDIEDTDIDNLPENIQFKPLPPFKDFFAYLPRTQYKI